MLNFDNVTFRYKNSEETIIRNLSFEVGDGEFICLIGASGCGKSTIFRLLNGLEELGAGTITCGGTDIRELKNYSSYMPQRDLLFPWRTIIDNVTLPMEIQKVSRQERIKKGEELLAEVNLLSYKDKYPRDLSGGMRQRVSFARTLCVGSDLLLLDEPFSALDSLTKIALQEWLAAEWSKLKKTVMFVTHDVEEALFLSTKIFVIRERPISTLDVVDVPLPFPRNREDLQAPEIQELKESLIKALKQEAVI